LASPRKIDDFEISITADGSPSLRIADSSGYVEKMHHNDGALSESLYIYGEAMDETIHHGWPLHVLSLGLGLGYNELITAAKALLHDITPDRALLYSFEIEPLLRRNFTQWVVGKPDAFSELYDLILQSLSAEIQIEAKAIREWLCTAFEMNRWRVRARFPDEAADVKEMTCMLYDAFSNKMSPELWTEDLITSQLQSLCAPGCVFSTYAATGALNRALKNTGFVKQDRRGFSGKRESTFAIRKAGL
jgi:tRNA U34 5-methylaminomethyl-2-thiouridine-forming methyltransferase MnmC